MVVVIARLLAVLLLGQDSATFDREWVCWWVPAGVTDEHREVCEYDGEAGRIFVAAHDDGMMEVSALVR